jgi:hypothetical protein
MLTSLGAGISSIRCACEFISGLWGGTLSRLLCTCSHVEGTCLGTHSELNPRTIESSKRLKTSRTLHGRVFKSSNLQSLSGKWWCGERGCAVGPGWVSAGVTGVVTLTTRDVLRVPHLRFRCLLLLQQKTDHWRSKSVHGELAHLHKVPSWCVGCAEHS